MAQNKKDVSSNIKVVSLEPKNQGPFKYFGVEVKTISTTGKVFLNRKQVHSFKLKDGGSMISSNEANDLIKEGENEITLQVKKIDLEGNQLGSKEEEYFILIALHGVNEAVGPSEESRTLTIKWSPDDTEENMSIKYVFNMKR